MNHTPNKRNYFPLKEKDIISIKKLREYLGEHVANRTDQEMEKLREVYYKLAYIIYYDWIDSLKK